MVGGTEGDTRCRYCGMQSAARCEHRSRGEASRLIRLRLPQRQPEPAFPPAPHAGRPAGVLVRDLAVAHFPFCESRLRVSCFLWCLWCLFFSSVRARGTPSRGRQKALVDEVAIDAAWASLARGLVVRLTQPRALKRTSIAEGTVARGLPR